MYTCLKGYMNLWIEVPYIESPLAMFDAHWFIASGEIKYLVGVLHGMLQHYQVLLSYEV